MINIVTVYFENHAGEEYKRLYDVFKKSVEKYSDTVNLISIKLPKVEKRKTKPFKLTSNTEKLKVWVRYAETMDTNTIFTDCDMLMTNPVDDIFKKDFDIAYTIRSNEEGKEHPKINGGVIFAKPTEQSRQYFRTLLDVNMKMYENEKLHEKWRTLYPGMNQSAMGYIIEKNIFDGKLMKLITKKYNAVDCDWSNMDGSEIFVHYKSKLKNLVLNHYPPLKGYDVAMKAWYEVAGVKEYNQYPPKRNIPGHRVRRRLTGARRKIGQQKSN